MIEAAQAHKKAAELRSQINQWYVENHDRKRTKPKGYVYFLENQSFDYIKVGFKVDKYITSQHYSELLKYKDLYEKEKKRADLLQADLDQIDDFHAALEQSLDKRVIN